MRRILLLLALVFTSFAAYAQNSTGTTLPASCRGTETFDLTGATPGRYVCVASMWVSTGLAASGGPGAGVSSIAADNTAQSLLNLNISNPTGAVTAQTTLNTQPSGYFFGNLNGAPAVPVFFDPATATPAFKMKNMTNFNLGTLAASALVTPITNGLIEELHIQESAGPLADFSGSGHNATVQGNVNLAGGLVGGMNVAPGGGVPTGTVLLDPALNTALTMMTYTCVDPLNAPSAAFFDTLLSGVMSATVPSGANTQAFGLMLNGAQGTALVTGVLAKLAFAPVVFNNAALTTQAVEAAGGCHTITWRRGTSTDDLFIDDHIVAGYTFQTAGTASTVPLVQFTLGAPNYATLNALYEHPYPIYYHNAFTRALAANEIATISGSIQKYMELRGVKKAKPQYSDAGNQLITVGDSITYGFNAGNVGWPSQLAGKTTTPYAVTNLGSTAWQLENMIAECEARGYEAINPNSNVTYLIFGGTNDLIGNTAGLPAVTPVVAYQRLRRLVQCYKKKGGRVFVTTMISRGSTATGVNSGNIGDQLKNPYNDLIRKDNAGADGTWDLASFAPLGADGAYSNTSGTLCGGTVGCFTGDSTHPSVGGQTTMSNNFANFINVQDSIENARNPKLVTAATYPETYDDTAINALPTAASQTITLPSAVAITGTQRYVFNAQATGTNTVTIAAASGENINGAATVLCANTARCTFRSVLGASQATTTADTLAGAHWEQVGGQASSSGSGGDAISIWSIPVGTAPTNGQVLSYNGTNIVGTTIAGGTVPTGAGFVHITGGAQDGAARAVNLASADVTGILPAANHPVAATGVLGLMSPDGSSITCNGSGVCSSTGAGGGAGLAANTFTGQQTMPALQNTPIADTGVVNAAVVANTAVTALNNGTIITFIPVATNTTGTPTLNVNGLGAKNITKLGNIAVVAGDVVISSVAVVIYNTAGSGTWQLLNPGTLASTNANQTFQGTQNFSTLNFTSVLQKGGVGVFPATRCVATTTAALTATCSATGTTTTGVCVAFPANSTAVTLNTTNAPFATVPTTNTPTLTFATTATAGAIYNVMCTPN